VADRHHPDSASPGSAAGGKGDSFSDDASTTRRSAGVDPSRALDSDTKRVRTDVAERLDGLLPGEADLVYQHLRGRLPTLFDDAGP